MSATKFPDTSKWPDQSAYLPGVFSEEEKAEFRLAVEESVANPMLGPLSLLRLAAKCARQYGLEYGTVLLREYSSRGGSVSGLIRMSLACHGREGSPAFPALAPTLDEPEVKEFLGQMRKALRE